MVLATDRLLPRSRSPDWPPCHQISDGFHSSLVVPTQGSDGALGTTAPWVELGFCDVAWTIDGIEGTRHACRLGLLPDDGCVEIGPIHDIDGFLAEPSLDWSHPVGLSQAGYDGLVQRLGWWVDVSAPIMAQIDGRAYRPSRRHFSAYNSCNDFVADLLKRAGVSICPRPWRTAGILRSQVRGSQKISASGTVSP